MNIRFLGVLFVLLISVCASMAQTKKLSDAHITGHVTDAKTGQHIPYATIGISGTLWGAVSDATGHFLLKNIDPAEHTVIVSFTGYKTIEQKVVVEKNRTIECKFELEPQILEMDEVVVTASRNNSNRRESSSIVNVLSAKLFENTASSNVAEALNFQSGLRVEYNCSNCGVPQLRINGLEGQYSQILLDSRPIFSSLASVYGLEQLPAGMIQRVEVIRGGGSALFGSNAIGGVVNIITKEPLRNTVTISNNTSVFEGGGADINTTINGAFVTDDYKAGIYVFGMIKDRSAYDRDKDGFSEIPKVNSETIGFRGYYNLTSQSKLTAEYHHIREFRRGGNLLNRPPHEADIAEQLRHGINGGGLKYDFFTRDNRHKLSVYGSLQNIARESYFGTHQNPSAYGTTKDFTYILGGQYAYSFRKLWFMPAELTAGVEYTDNRLNDKMLGYNRTVDQHTTCYGGFLQNEWKNKNLSMLIGVRLDKHNKVSKPIFSPRVNIRYTPIQEIAIRASYSSGYRAPQAYEEDLHVAAVGGEVAIISIDPDLRPEYSQSVSASVDLYHKFGSVQANLLIEGFYTNLRDIFVLVENGVDAAGNLLLERRNASGAEVTGINLELKLGITPKVILDGGYTFQRSLYHRAQTWSDNPNLAPTRQMFRAPDQYGYITVNYNPVKGFSSSLSCTYTGEMLVQHYAGFIAEDAQTTTPHFWDMALRLAYDFRLTKQMTLQLSGGVKNILNSFQRDLDQGVTRDAGYIYGPSMPRSYFVGLKFTV